MAKTTTTKAKKETSPVVQQEATKAISTQTAMMNPAEWGMPVMTSKDIIIPKILAMQGLSKAVIKGEAKFGDFRDSLSLALKGDLKTPMAFVPFYMEKVWVKFEERNGTMKFAGVSPITPANEDQPLEGVANGTKYRVDRTLNIYALLEGEENKLPYILSFRRTSLRAGNKIATVMFVSNLNEGLTPASKVLYLTGEAKENDKGHFVVMDVKEKGPSSDAQVAKAFEWVKRVRGGQTKADNSDLVEEAAHVAATTSVDDIETTEF